MSSFATSMDKVTIRFHGAVFKLTGCLKCLIDRQPEIILGKRTELSVTDSCHLIIDL